ncbi:MAG TPA: alpha-glucan family phosphorylase [Myxococcales bacterium LLY-WYZ-16_1]|nr:alpha-glucan family phosphorylase [Myxococcales bacterium LLY-WYZ-16_1]
MTRSFRFVQVKPSLPGPLEGLETLAYNLLWDWEPEIRSLFVRIDPELWERVSGNPVALLGSVDQKRLEQLSSDVGFLSHLGRARDLFDRYMLNPRWYQTEHVEHSSIKIGYFSAEFGLTACLPIYSGGLGVLAGDHLKSASDLGLPLFGVGLLYQEGYFRQYLNADGWQMERYPPNDFYNMPIRKQTNADGSEVRVEVEFPGRQVHARVWRVDVGRVPLFLLDTNVSENSEADRGITRSLYGGGVELRIQQLMVLGIGGFRALVQMGLEPTVCHMNEGHAGFLGVERARFVMESRGFPYELAQDVAEDGNIFTTHTPVPAGFDVFGRDLVERYLGDYAAKVGLSMDDFMALGRKDRNDHQEPFNMAILAIRHAVRRNGVSELHGRVSRKMAQDRGAWRKWPRDEVPIDHVTNGVHQASVVAPAIARLFDRYLPPDWRDRVADPAVWESVENIPDEELWRIHCELRMQLISFVRKRIVNQATSLGSSMHADGGVDALNPDALTVGFARRFATYKRATLLLSDPDRLLRLISASERPIQFIFSGKAHPADHPAKEYIQKIANTVKDRRFGNSIVFIEDYDIDIARRMVQGVDLWLNNPQRPREASGTSGMKLIPNGGLNCSILDGWWAEGYDPQWGWAIGNGEPHTPDRDSIEASALYDVFESQVVPTFYDRDARQLPRRWIRMMKAQMKALAGRFNTDRMVQEYANRFYLPAARHYLGLSQCERSETEEIAGWKKKVRHLWHDIRIEDVRAESEVLRVGDRLEVTARVHLNGLCPSEVRVQVYHGQVDARDEVRHALTETMSHQGEQDGLQLYRARVPCEGTGRHGFTVRVIPHHPKVVVPNELTQIRWAP